MSVSRFNSEGYHDPVVYEALTNMEKEQRAAVKAASAYCCDIIKLYQEWLIRYNHIRKKRRPYYVTSLHTRV